MNDKRTFTHRTRIWPMLVYVAFLAIGIPWYWPLDNYAIAFGLPGWVVVAIVVSFGASIFTALLLRRAWPDEDPYKKNRD